MATLEKPTVTRRRFTVDEYHRMAEIGVLLEDERVELIEGEILRMSAKGSRHNGAIIALDDLLREQLDRGTAVISVQNSIAIDEYTEPEPDIALLRPRRDNYRQALPSPADVLLLIEVADTSLAYDRGLKLPLYARAGIPEVWIVDLTNEAIERYANPANGAYRSVNHAAHGQTITPSALPSLVLAVGAVLV
jgi:Uma2 family endonuclease